MKITVTWFYKLEVVGNTDGLLISDVLIQNTTYDPVRASVKCEVHYYVENYLEIVILRKFS